MKFAAFKTESNIHLGIVSEEHIINLHAVEREYKKHHSTGISLPSDMKQLIEQSDSLLPYVEELLNFANEERGTNFSLPLSEVEILAPVSNPEKIICVGLNYLDHCKETGMEPPKSPVIFSKYANAIIGEKEAIEIPVNSSQVDYEAELAIVIGKEAKHVTEEEAEEFIFGYTIMNDISARDQQFADGQWSRGKSADTFAPIGPVIVTKDEVGDPHCLDISLTLNGEIMQDSNTENLIFKVPQIVSYLSQSMTLRPGDIIATGTPPGVGMGRDPQVWMKDGDLITVSIERIGTLTNSVKKALSTGKVGKKELPASL